MSFENGVIGALKKLYDEPKITSVSMELVRPKVKEIFSDAAVAALQNDPSRPVACILSINNKVPILELPFNIKKINNGLDNCEKRSTRKKALKQAYADFEIAQKKLKTLELQLKPDTAELRSARAILSNSKESVREKFLAMEKCSQQNEKKFKNILCLFEEKAVNKFSEKLEALVSIEEDLKLNDAKIGTAKEILKYKEDRYKTVDQLIATFSSQYRNTTDTIEKYAYNMQLKESQINGYMTQRKALNDSIAHIKGRIASIRSKISVSQAISPSNIDNKIRETESGIIKADSILLSLQKDSVSAQNTTDRQNHLLNSLQKELLILYQNKNQFTELEENVKVLTIEQEQYEQLYQNNLILSNALKSERLLISGNIFAYKTQADRINQKIGPLLIERDTLLAQIKREQATVNKLIEKKNEISKNFKIKTIEANQAAEEQPRDTMIVEYVQMEFNDGYIENIMVLGHLINKEQEKYKFENVFPIGFSTKKNFDDMGNFSLFEKKFQKTYQMKMEDILTMVEQNHFTSAKDYSPENQTLTVRPPIDKIVLYKANTSKLFEAQFFTDLIGFKEFNPNGLVQTLVNRRIPLQTHRLPLFAKRFNFGYFAYVEPSVSLSKLEQKERFFPVESKDDIRNNTLFSRKFATTIQLKSYENFSTGLDLNGILVDCPNFKSTLFLDFGFRYGRTGIIDSFRIFENGQIKTSEKEPNKYNVNTYQLYPKFTWKILPDARYGFSLSYQWNLFILRDNRLKQIENREEFLYGKVPEYTNWFGSFHLGGFFKPDKDKDNKLFFRYLFHHQFKQWNTNFDQVQIGYSFFLTFPKTP
ncbi:MAG: hypothetical protein IT271_04405 [Chitinophagales bacterium]|nr:hypothetical protein [Chitinophagales bacterium]